MAIKVHALRRAMAI